MVGVPTSKGCALCLKRSIKCDEARPSCSQCRRGGRFCPGFIRPAKFVDEGPKLRHRSAQASNPCFLDSSSSRSSSSSSKCETNLRPRYPQNQFTTTLHQPRPWKLERGQILASFVTAMFPLGVATEQKSFLGSWLWHIPPRLGCSEVLDEAALSLALAYISRMHEDQLGLRNAELVYTRALKRLAAAIADTRLRFDSTVLCATLLLGNYETLSDTTFSWIRHAGGAGRLMQLRGARLCYDSAFEYSMFLACRGTLVSWSVHL
ncbi:hypothetical protein GQ53DRAFT_855809 [Thozetella sp. PMI_491]|nr:hypothetical protein GQ53DRAFT_855809 [Thozetella sp. PMI_491]